MQPNLTDIVETKLHSCSLQTKYVHDGR